jgi:dolichol-phosphate mannosyltransferase
MNGIGRILHWRFWRFAVVGALGVLVNSFVLMLAHDRLGIALEFASPIAIAVAILHNFAWNNAWTYRSQPHRDLGDWFGRLARYYVSSSVGALLNYLVLLALVHLVHWNEYLANLVGIAAGMASNFLLSEIWVFRRRGAL